MPGMDDEPTTTFTNLSVLFSKLGISEGVDGGEERENGEEGGGEGSGGIKWREVETGVKEGSTDSTQVSTHQQVVAGHGQICLPH